MLASHEELRRKNDEMEEHYDSRWEAVFASLRQMIESPIRLQRQIGFRG